VDHISNNRCAARNHTHPALHDLTHSNHRVHCNDDILHFNTQGSTQWDGFRHYAYTDYPTKDSYVFYNGLSREQAKDKSIYTLGIQSEPFSISDVVYQYRS
jgi:hypothetical protein